MENITNTSHISDLIRQIMKSADVTQDMAAKSIGKPLSSFRNKLSLDRFSLKELMIISELCDYHLALVPENVTKSPEFILADQYINAEELTTMKEYRKERLQKHLDVLNTYMVGMSVEEKAEFIREHLPNMIKGTEKFD